MTDHNPLAPLEKLLNDLRMSDSRYSTIRDLDIDHRLHTALAEAREAVDALVAERDAASELAADMKVLADGYAKQAHALEQERDAAQAKVARFAQLLAGAAQESNAALSKLAQRLEEAEAERDRAKTACKTLGGIVEQQCRDILKITGLHDWIDEHGDGDWGAVWENAYSLPTVAEWRRHKAERDRLRDTITQSDRSHLVLIEHLLAALGLADETTEAEASALLGGCDCNGEGGSRHLLGHLIQQHDQLRKALGRVADLLTVLDQSDDGGRIVWASGLEVPVSDLRDGLRAALARPATDEEAGQ